MTPEEQANFSPASPAEDRFRKAADRVSRGWPQPVQGRIDRRDEGSQVALVWLSGGAQRAVAMRYENGGGVSISGAAASAQDPTSGSPIRQDLRTWTELPDENDLTMSLRLAMEVVESWQPGAQVGVATR